MSELHALLGDRATPVLQAAIAADDPDHLRKAQLVGGNLGQLMWLTTAERLDRVLMAVLPDLLAEVEAERDALAEEVADMVPRDWHGLMTILADVYPETAFPTLPDHEARDAGPRIVSLLRRVDDLASAIERVRGMAEAWATQPTDYDEDTEQQIEDGKAILRALDGGERCREG